MMQTQAKRAAVSNVKWSGMTVTDCNESGERGRAGSQLEDVNISLDRAFHPAQALKEYCGSVPTLLLPGNL